MGADKDVLGLIISAPINALIICNEQFGINYQNTPANITES